MTTQSATFRHCDCGTDTGRSDTAERGLLTGVRDWIERSRRRARVRAMLDMNDRMLRDIGLEREDIKAVLRQAGSVDPVDRLNSIRRHRIRTAL